MNKRSILLIAAAFTIGSLALADIQSSPASRWNWSRKLSRSLANIIYGVTEIPVTWCKSNNLDGSSAAWTTMAVDGTKRSVVRLGYGVFELVTFPFPAYKDGYRPPFRKKEAMDSYSGYGEFPPQFGHSSQTTYCRDTDYHPF